MRRGRATTAALFSLCRRRSGPGGLGRPSLGGSLLEQGLRRGVQRSAAAEREEGAGPNAPPWGRPSRCEERLPGNEVLEVIEEL